MAMRGICISFNPRNVGTIWPKSADAGASAHTVPEDDTPFCFFFRPVFPHLRDLYWFASGFESTPFVRLIYEDGGEERLDSAQMDVGLGDVNCVLHRPGTLPELAPYLSNDWVNLVGLRCPEHHAIEAARRLALARHNFEDGVGAEAELAFFCMDGFWWEFYPRDPSLLDEVAIRLEGVAGVVVRPCDLRNRRALFGDSRTT